MFGCNPIDPPLWLVFPVYTRRMNGEVPWGLSTKPVVVPREGLDPAVTEPDDTEYVGLAVFGPRKDVDKLTGKLSLAR